MTLLERLGVTIPIVQAPMAGVSTPALAAAVSNAGGLGSIGVGASDAADARAMIEATRALTDRAFNVNLFVHATPRIDKAREQGWLEAFLRRKFSHTQVSSGAAWIPSSIISRTSINGVSPTSVARIRCPHP